MVIPDTSHADIVLIGFGGTAPEPVSFIMSTNVESFGNNIMCISFFRMVHLE